MRQSTSFSKCSALVCATLLVLFGAGTFAHAQETVVVPKVTIYPGDVVTNSLLEERKIRSRKLLRIPRLRSRTHIVGKVARRTLLPGYPIPVNGVRRPDTVSRGKPVEVIFRSQGLTITSKAMPLQSGSTGDIVSFRNLDSGTIVTGRIKADGTIQVGRL